MNIFYLSDCPEQSAKDHCDKHVVKMILETAQLLSTAYRNYYKGDKRSFAKWSYSDKPSWWTELSYDY